MKQIPLTQGLFALVDNEDFEELNKFKWCAIKVRESNNYYAARGVNMKTTTLGIKMHRYILGLTDPKIKCDHIDHNGLNNQRYNLRPSTNAENTRNRGSKPNSSSIYKGVTWNKKAKKWIAQININGKNKYLGSFIDEIEAAKVYDVMAKLHHGEFAWLNFK